MIYERDIKKTLQRYLARREIIAIKGPRQAGKTTLLKDLYSDMAKRKKCLFLTFEKRDDLEIFEKDIENFKHLYVERYPVIFIDEFQYAKEGGQKLKYLFDTTECKFIISGSSSLELTSKTSSYLVGRLFSFHLYPFSFSEFLRINHTALFDIIQSTARKTNDLFSFSLPNQEPLKSASLKEVLYKLLEEYIIFGGYPAVVLSKTLKEKEQVLKGILETYLLRDIKTLLALATDEELILLAKFLALQIGNISVYQELSNASKLSLLQVKRHLTILHETYLLEFILPYFVNKRTELTKNPKIYFLDTGFRNMLIGNFSPLVLRSDSGALFENYVFSQLKRKVDIIGGIKFWRTKSGAEIDFILEKGKNTLPIEVKYSLGQTLNIGKSFYSFLQKYRPPSALIITRNIWGRKTIDNTHLYFLPAFYL